MPGYRQALSILLSFTVTISVVSLDGCKKSEQAQPEQAGQAQPAQQPPAATYAAPTADQLYQLVAPIALFPDNLVAMVLAASTYPDQVSAAYQWLQQNSSLKGQQLAEAANQQPWDASVKGLTQFSDVLSQMATNLSWTSALGDAYYNIPQSVMNAVQVMRQRAYQAGNLKSNQQQNVSVQNQAPGAAPPPTPAGEEPQTTVVQPPPQTIIIQPAQPEVVYVPTYNPTVVYGAPVRRLSRILDRRHGGHQPAFLRSRHRGGRGDQRRRWMLRMGIQLMGMRLAQQHRGLQPQHLHLQLEYLRESQQLLQPQRE